MNIILIFLSCKDVYIEKDTQWNTLKKHIEKSFFQKDLLKKVSKPYNEKDNGPSLSHSMTKISKTFLMSFVMPVLVRDIQSANDSKVIDLKSCLFFGYLKLLR